MNLANARRFLEIIDKAMGYYCVIYSGNRIKELIVHADAETKAFFGRHPLWLAQYGSHPVIPAPWTHAFLWQYTGDGSGPTPHNIPGIGNKVDISSFDGTDEELKAQWSFRPAVVFSGPAAIAEATARTAAAAAATAAAKVAALTEATAKNVAAAAAETAAKAAAVAKAAAEAAAKATKDAADAARAAAQASEPVDPAPVADNKLAALTEATAQATEVAATVAKTAAVAAVASTPTAENDIAD
jgi:Tfp pilus assembly protein FimV